MTKQTNGAFIKIVVSLYGKLMKTYHLFQRQLDSTNYSSFLDYLTNENNSH
jgi:hypothetical protein